MADWNKSAIQWKEFSVHIRQDVVNGLTLWIFGECKTNWVIICDLAACSCPCSPCSQKYSAQQLSKFGTPGSHTHARVVMNDLGWLWHEIGLLSLIPKLQSASKDGPNASNWSWSIQSLQPQIFGMSGSRIWTRARPEGLGVSAEHTQLHRKLAVSGLDWVKFEVMRHLFTSDTHHLFFILKTLNITYANS